MAPIKPRLFKGTRDLPPGEMIPREETIERMKRVFRLYGFSPLETPALEMLDVLSGKYGVESEKLIYRLDYKNDRPKDRVALRYDLTVPLARVIAMHPEWPMPFKRYQVQPVWRADRPQPHQGRFREFYQCDVDTIGAEEGIADAGIIHLTVRLMGEMGFGASGKRAVVLVNHRKILEALCLHAGLKEKQLTDFCRMLDKLDKTGWESVRDELGELGVDSAGGERLEQVFALEGDSEKRLGALAELLPEGDAAREGVEGLRLIFRHYHDLVSGSEHNPSVEVRFEPRLARGLDYYTGAVFETILPDHPHIGSLTGGGRYDRLIGLYSGRDLPAVGTTIGIDRIVTALAQLGEMTEKHLTVTRVLFAVVSEEQIGAALKMVARFRDSGIETDIYPVRGRMKKAFAYADKMGIRYVAVVGPDELADPADPKVTLKDLKRSEQDTLSVAKVLKTIKNPPDRGD